MRWGQFGSASKFVKEEHKTRFLEKNELDQELMNFTDMQVVTTDLSEDDENKGTCRVWATFYRLPDPTLRKELWVQNWSFDEEKRWWTIEIPEFEKEDQKKNEISKKTSLKNKKKSPGSFPFSDGEEN